MKMKTTGFISIIACIVLSGCMTFNQGLKPIKPQYSPYSWSEDVDTLTPKFVWSPYDDTSDKQDFRYQLRILDGNVVQLFKDGIKDNYYVVEEPLLPNKEYQWAVRAAWSANGKPEGESWNYKKYFYLTPVLFGWGNKPYKVYTPEEIAYVPPKPKVATDQPEEIIVSDSSIKKIETIESKPLPTQATPSASDDFVTLEKLHSLHDKGIITDAEYKKKKQEIIDRM